jgi:hypothetical protein
LIVTCSKEPVGILYHLPICVSARQQYLWCDPGEVAVSSVMIGIRVGVHRHRKPVKRQSMLSEVGSDHGLRRVRFAGIQQENVVADEDILKQVSVGDARPDLVDVREDLYIRARLG